VFIGASHPEELAGYRKQALTVQIGDTPNRLETRVSIGFQADTPQVNRTVLTSNYPQACSRNGSKRGGE
jgi:hypothetical protein